MTDWFIPNSQKFNQKYMFFWSIHKNRFFKKKNISIEGQHIFTLRHFLGKKVKDIEREYHFYHHDISYIDQNTMKKAESYLKEWQKKYDAQTIRMLNWIETKKDIEEIYYDRK